MPKHKIGKVGWSEDMGKDELYDIAKFDLELAVTKRMRKGDLIIELKKAQRKHDRNLKSAGKKAPKKAAKKAAKKTAKKTASAAKTPERKAPTATAPPILTPAQAKRQRILRRAKRRRIRRRAAKAAAAAAKPRRQRRGRK